MAVYLMPLSKQLRLPLEREGTRLSDQILCHSNIFARFFAVTRLFDATEGRLGRRRVA